MDLNLFPFSNILISLFYLMAPNDLLGVCRLQLHGDGERSVMKDVEKLSSVSR
jgi:hypothetical protein